MKNIEAKQEAIKKAWGSEYESVKNDLDFDGALEIYSHNPFTEITYFDKRTEWDGYFDRGFYSITEDKGNTIKISPIELKGVKDNNGWTRIEPHGRNLPYHPTKTYKTGTLNKYDFEQNSKICSAKIVAYRFEVPVDKITHYKPTVEDLPPIY